MSTKCTPYLPLSKTSCMQRALHSSCFHILKLHDRFYLGKDWLPSTNCQHGQLNFECLVTDKQVSHPEVTHQELASSVVRCLQPRRQFSIHFCYEHSIPIDVARYQECEKYKDVKRNIRA
uniref:Uncharacterized protein n=1 Tax=Rhipicephalus microplus TaxID=6941 RepID=A0A6G5AGU2_RHIMP